MKYLPRAAAAALLLLLAACAELPPATPSDAVTGSPWARASEGSPAHPWSHQAFPGKTPTQFRYARVDGRDTIAASADSSASMLRHDVHVAAQDLGHVRFSWKVPALMEEADMALRDKDDAPVRLVLVFDGDRSKFSAKDAALSELARLLTGEEMPYATLMYVWCNKRPPGSIIHSPRTDRIRKLVVESGPARLNHWLEYERDIRADYERVFGEAPGALVGVGLMTDSDNTRSVTQAWYGPVRLVR